MATKTISLELDGYGGCGAQNAKIIGLTFD